MECDDKNDTLLKIHLHNVVLLREVFSIANEIKKGRIIHDKVRRSLPGLADYLHYHPKYPEIKGVIGITMLSKGSERLGFEVMPIYLLTLSSFMSKNMLMQRYGRR